jgi:hypothetical protein
MNDNQDFPPSFSQLLDAHATQASNDDDMPDMSQFFSSFNALASPTFPFSVAAPTQPASSLSGKPAAKRKRAPKEELLKPNPHIVWEYYVPHDTPIMSIHERLTPQPLYVYILCKFSLFFACSQLHRQVLFHVGHIDKNAIVEGDKWCVFRQNQVCFSLSVVPKAKLLTHIHSSNCNVLSKVH